MTVAHRFFRLSRVRPWAAPPDAPTTPPCGTNFAKVGMIYAETASRCKPGAAFGRKWRLRCLAVATRLQQARERLQETLKRRIKAQAVLPFQPGFNRSLQHLEAGGCNDRLSSPALKRCGDAAVPARLVASARGEAGPDPCQDIKGNALGLLWPDHLSVAELFPLLIPTVLCDDPLRQNGRPWLCPGPAGA